MAEFIPKLAAGMIVPPENRQRAPRRNRRGNPNLFAPFRFKKPVDVLRPQISRVIESAEIAGVSGKLQRSVQLDPVSPLPLAGFVLLFLA
ncbi:hypothetical protein VQ056_18355 [Paenibacillus sp. JTLBN-2024]